MLGPTPTRPAPLAQLHRGAFEVSTHNVQKKGTANDEEPIQDELTALEMVSSTVSIPIRKVE